ncbi:PC-esterase domain-containing protein 1A-like [Babylonia areolata]|uniref:PC-esterase domain-containing protein 1A-like n=1 Tax=Babylonia areolata TaxID=304850 RepID=UPI003FD21B38
MTFLSDTLIEGGVKEGLNNGVTYTEVRQYQTSTHLIRFYFVTRCYNAYVESVLRDLEEEPKPDLVIMNSCLWDITRYGTSAIIDYKENMGMLFYRLTKVLPPDCLMVWNTTLPISRNARGGFLVKEIQHNNQTLRMDVLEANFFARQIVVNHGFDILDLHFWFRHRIDWRVADGIHWNPTAHRYISELLLSHVATAWGFPFPPIQFSSLSHPLMQRPDPALHGPLIDVATRLNGEPPRRSNGYGRSVTVYRRPAPYAVLPPPPLPQRPPRYDQENDYRPGWSSNNDFQSCNTFLPQSSKYFVPDLSETENFRNGWSPYCGDNFRGPERRPGRFGRSRNAYY